MTTPHTQGRDALQKAYAALPAEEASGHRWLMETYATVIDALVARFDGQVAGKSVIDVGAGRGIVALALRFLGMEVAACERYVFAQNPEGMFHSKDAERILRVWQAHGVHPLIGDVTRLSEVCKERQFDAAVSIQVIEHLPEPKKMLDGIYTVLKPGGTLVLSAPNYGRLQARLRLLFGKNPKMDLADFYLRGAEGFIGHWREYLPGEIRQMLEWSGLTEVRSVTVCDPWFSWKKHPSASSAKDVLIHGMSKLIPGSQYDLLSVSMKK